MSDDPPRSPDGNLDPPTWNPWPGADPPEAWPAPAESAPIPPPYADPTKLGAPRPVATGKGSLVAGVVTFLNHSTWAIEVDAP